MTVTELFSVDFSNLEKLASGCILFAVGILVLWPVFEMPERKITEGKEE